MDGFFVSRDLRNKIYRRIMKNKLGIFTALILSLVIAGSAFAGSPANSTRKAAAKATVSKTTKKSKKHHKHKAAKKSVKKPTTKTATTPTNKQ